MRRGDEQPNGGSGLTEEKITKSLQSVGRETLKAMKVVVSNLGEDPYGVTATVKTVFGVATTIYDQVQKVKANKVRTLRLAERIADILTAIGGLDELTRSERFKPLLEKFGIHLNDCKTFMVELSSKSWAKRFFLAGTYDDRFNEFNEKLEEVKGDLGLGMHAQQIVNQEQDKKDREQDQQELLGKIDEIMVLQKAHKYGLEQLNEKMDGASAGIAAKIHEDIEKLIIAQIDSLKLTFMPQIARREYEDGIDPRVIVPFHQIKFGDVIKQGSFATVYLGMFRGSPVVIKTLEGKITSQNREQFRREVQIMSRLRHRHVMQFYGACVGEHVALLTEYMEKGALYDLLEREPLTPEQQRQLALDVAKGLDYLHQQEPKIIHRNLESSSVLIDQHGTAKVADFRLSKIDTASIKTACERSAFCQWTAPELFEPDGQYTEKSDIYAYGVILLEIISGRRPCEGISEEKLKEYINTSGMREAEISSDIPEVYANIIRQCWSPIPRNRPQLSNIIRELERYRIDLSGEELYERGCEYQEQAKEREGEISAQKRYEQQAREMYERSAAKEFCKAYTNLGLFNLQGKGGLKPDKTRALSLIQKGANGGHARGQFNLGQMLEYGDGVEQDLPRAKFWYKRAAEQEDENAKGRLSRIREKIQGQRQIGERASASVEQLPGIALR